MTTITMKEVAAFLLGEAPLDGAWFGDTRPSEHGQFWWRKHLRAALEAPATAVDDRHAQALLAQDITIRNMAERHAQELCAYQVTVDKLRAELEAAQKDAARYRWLAAYARRTSEHWGGRWSLVIDGPAPKSHNSEDDIDEAIDAAIAAQEQA